MATLGIRPARAGEAILLTELAIRSKAHWGYDTEFIERCREELTVGERAIRDGRVSVAFRGEDVLGFASLDLDRDPAELEALFVEPDAMGAGLGRQLLREALALASQRGHSTLRIESDPCAEPFYLRCGARRIGERRSQATGRALPLLEIDCDGRSTSIARPGR